MRLAENFPEALKACYGWKSPIAKTKNEEFSLVMFLMAAFFCFARFFWVIQAVKLVVRTTAAKGPSADIPPIYLEVYVLGCIGLWAGLLYVAPGFIDDHPLLVLIAAAVNVFETVTSNFYYLLLRPSLKNEAPHSIYRSFLMAFLSYAQAWLGLSVVWYALSRLGGPAMLMHGTEDFRKLTAAQSMYFVLVTTTTLGYGDIVPDPKNSLSLGCAMATIMVGVSMISVVISRAISLIPPPPAPPGAPPKLPD